MAGKGSGDYGQIIRSTQNEETNKITRGRKTEYTNKPRTEQSASFPKDNMPHSAGIAHAILGGRRMM
jgi:hypothetical protein